MIFSVLASSVIFPIVGRLCDSFEPRKILPFSFLIRFISTVLFCFLNHPNSYQAYAICVLMVVGTIVNNICTDSIFYKNLPKETRGILNGAYSFAGQLGILIYSIAAGYLFDIFSKSPFILLGALDLIFVFIFLIFSCV